MWPDGLQWDRHTGTLGFSWKEECGTGEGHIGHDQSLLPHSQCTNLFILFLQILLMWTIFKVFIEFVIILLLLLLFFFWLRDRRDLSSPNRDQTLTPALEGEVLTPGPPGKSLKVQIF